MITIKTLSLRIGQPELNQMLEKQADFHPPVGPSRTRLITEFREFEQSLAKAEPQASQ